MGIKGGIEGELVVEMRAGVRVGDEVRVSRIAAEVYICYWREGRGRSEMIFGSQLVLAVTGKQWKTVCFFLYQGMRFLSTWKTPSGTTGAVSKLPAIDHLSHPLTSASPRLPPPPSASISSS